jgi:phosphate transport system protein
MSTVRRTLETDMKELQEMVLAMGSKVKESLRLSVKALKERDRELMNWVIKNDDVIDELARSIDQKAVATIATQQPMAGDLRILVGIIRTITDLERIGDLSESVAKQGLKIVDQPLLKPLIDIPRMVEIVDAMLEDGLQAFMLRDANRAEKMCLRDDEIDGLRDQVQRELLTYMIEDPKTIPRATALLVISLFLERAGDHATNIGEHVIYMVTGEVKDLNI